MKIYHVIENFIQTSIKPNNSYKPESQKGTLNPCYSSYSSLSEKNISYLFIIHPIFPFPTKKKFIIHLIHPFPTKRKDLVTIYYAKKMSTQFIDFIDNCELPAGCNVMPTKLICDVCNFQSAQETFII